MCIPNVLHFANKPCHILKTTWYQRLEILVYIYTQGCPSPMQPICLEPIIARTVLEDVLAVFHLPLTKYTSGVLHHNPTVKMLPTREVVREKLCHQRHG